MFSSKSLFSEILNISTKDCAVCPIQENVQSSTTRQEKCCTQLPVKRGLHQVYNRKLRSTCLFQRFLESYWEVMSNQDQRLLKTNRWNSAQLLWKWHRILCEKDYHLMLLFKRDFIFRVMTKRFLSNEKFQLERWFRMVFAWMFAAISELLKIIFHGNEISIVGEFGAYLMTSPQHQTQQPQ